MSPREKPRLAVLISGRGSNLQAFIDACTSGELDAQIGLVISNNPEAAGLQRAARADLTTRCINHSNYSTREAFDQALVDELRAHSVDLVVLAGFMRILTPVLIEPYLGRLLNIHPSLLPKYPGLHTHQRAMDAGDRHHAGEVEAVARKLRLEGAEDRNRRARTHAVRCMGACAVTQHEFLTVSGRQIVADLRLNGLDAAGRGGQRRKDII